jgi:hypothetical protein
MAVLLEQDYHFHDTGSRFNSADTRSSRRTLRGWLIAGLWFGVRHSPNKPPPNIDFDSFALYAKAAELDAAFCVALLPSL